MERDPYADAGVDVREGESFSAFASRVRRTTFRNCPYIFVLDLSGQDFRGRDLVFLRHQEYPFLRTCALGVAADGAGTKTILVDAAQTWQQAAFDVMAMCGGDVTRDGGLPVAFSNVLDVSNLGKEGDATNRAFRQTLLGLGAAAALEGVVLIGGETAELGVCVGSENPGATTKFNWSGFMLGLYRQEKMTLGNTVHEGQIILALKENGFRSNGISLVRQAFRTVFGEHWWENPATGEAIQEAATPSVLYDKMLAEANGWFGPTRIPAELIVHLTGGSFGTKLGSKLRPLGLSARLNDLFEPPPIMQQCADWLGLDDEEAYRVWHGGQGALVVLHESDVERFLAVTKVHGVGAKVCGKITKEDNPAITITSKFRSGKEIRYEHGGS